MKKSSSDKWLLRELIFVLIIKVIVLYAIWYVFFDTPQTIDSPKTIDEKLFNLSTDQGDQL